MYSLNIECSQCGKIIDLAKAELNKDYTIEIHDKEKCYFCKECNVIEVNRKDIELITKIEAMGTWESEKYNFDLHNSFDIWSFNDELYKIYKDSDKLE